MLEIGTFQRREQYHPYQQQQAYIDEFPARPARGTPRPARPNSYSRPNSYYPDEYVNPSPGWPPSIAGRSDSQTFVDSAAASRSSVRSWKTGQQTPVDSFNSPRYGAPFHPDSGPSTPMVSNYNLLLAQALSSSSLFFCYPMLMKWAHRTKVTLASLDFSKQLSHPPATRTGLIARALISCTSEMTAISGRAGSGTCSDWFPS